MEAPGELGVGGVREAGGWIFKRVGSGRNRKKIMQNAKSHYGS